MRQVDRNYRRAFRRAPTRDRRGVATVEFAIVAPLMIILLLGTIDVGQYVSVGQAVSSASREGTRLAARDTTATAAEVTTAVLEYFTGCYPETPETSVDAALDVTVRNEAGMTITDLTTVGTGSALSVEVQFDFSSVRWLDGASPVSDETLISTTTMRRE